MLCVLELPVCASLVSCIHMCLNVRVCAGLCVCACVFKNKGGRFNKQGAFVRGWGKKKTIMERDEKLSNKTREYISGAPGKTEHIYGEKLEGRIKKVVCVHESYYLTSDEIRLKEGETLKS